ncbi:PREDICTED: putative gustatory receptor 28b [Trachymyrmex cornetzi]|uniref:putative gustatory receptor 28b n=1 Tax=Trachymyrmex cornetzi TaxID=471704 RepID=UPI00084F7CEA|nr:PREDICTED: putative gustatory receptor 28b [Trachymyrmex cornetzi]
MEVSSKLPSKSYQKLSRLIHIKDILACFKNINDNLVHIQKIVINDMKSRVSNVICHTQRNNFLLIELRILKKKHLMTSNAVQMLNIIFNLQLLAAIVMSFLIVTFELYFYAVRWQNGVLIGLDWHFLDVLVTSVTYNIFQIILIVWACETGKNQARNIGTTVHDLLNSTNNEKIKYELQLFSLQLLHRKNTFSMKGLTIDATLLAAIVGNITTYLLILIQFSNMSHSCDREAAISVTQSN